MVVESTYGNVRHPALEERLLVETLDRAIRRGGCCLMPTFAVDRTPAVHALRRSMGDHRVPRVPIYVDSPMAIRAWDVYRKAAGARNPQFRSGLGAEVLDWGADVVAIQDVEESRRLNDPPHPRIIRAISQPKGAHGWNLSSR